MSQLVNLNGTFIPREDAQLSINNGAFLYGDSLFETLKAQGKRILLQKEHLDRLELSAKLIDFPCDRPRIETALQQISAALSAPTSRIRLTLSRGSQQGLTLPAQQNGWFLITATPTQEPTEDERQRGAFCVIAPNHRVNPLDHLPQMKRGNYADCLYAGDYAHRRAAREALFIDAQNNLLEGHTSNLFALIDGKLVTPPTGKLILAGITRRQILAAASELGILTVERDLPMAELRTASEAFLSNALIDILPISRIENHPIRRGEQWKELLKTLRLRIET